MLFSAVGALMIAIALWLIVRDDPSERGYASFAPSDQAESDGPGPVFSGLLKVFHYKNTWLLTLAPGGIVGPVLAFSGLWGVPFLTTHYGLSPVKSAALTSTLLVAWGVGGPLLGGISDRIGSRKLLYLGGCVISSIGWALILYIQALPVWLLTALIIIVGFASGAMIIGFVFAKESVPSPLAGTVSGVCNMGVMSGPMLLQPAMGLILDKHWNGVLENGIRIYDLGAYRAAFALMMGWSICSIVLIAFTRETRCRQMDAG